MNNYEGLFIIKPDLSQEDVKNVFKVISESITKTGGNVKKEDSWGKKQLAYPVKKFKEGYYYRLDFVVPPDAVSKLEDIYKLNPSILRTMITRK